MSHIALPGRLSTDDPDLTERQREVLFALVREHRRSARPVSSECLVTTTAVRGSAAGVRSVLAELESLGLLARSHVSAGRVPSGAGYAFYVRQGITPQALPPEMLAELDERLNRSTADIEELLHEAARVLAGVSLQLGLALSCSLDEERLVQLELAGLTPDRALLVLSLAGGSVRTLKLELDSPLAADALHDVERMLRERLTGRTVREVRDRLRSDPELARDAAVHMVTRAFAEVWRDADGTTLFSAGAGRIASQPEFASGSQLGSLLQVIEDGPPLDRLMVGTVEGHAEVRLALDEVAALNGMSLISYPLPGAPGVAVGVLGPMRMDYARALAVVEAVGSRLAAYF